MGFSLADGHNSLYALDLGWGALNYLTTHSTKTLSSCYGPENTGLKKDDFASHSLGAPRIVGDRSISIWATNQKELTMDV